MLSVGTLGSDLDGASNQTIETFHAQDALFSENAGQWENAEVYFGYNKGGTQIYFTDESIEFGLSKRELKDGVDPAAVDELEMGLPGEEEDLYETTSTHFSLNFDGAAATIPAGADRAETVFNYHLGPQEDWVDGVATYNTVIHDDLYDGIDLHTFSRHAEMKYEFHVAPGADWSDIQLSYNGIEGLSIGEDGSLRIQTELGTVVDEGLYIYQTIDGEQVEVAGEFTLLDADTYTFTVTGDYDPSVELIIDPEVEWGSYIGGTNTDYARGVATDASGNVYVAGQTFSSGWVSGGYDDSYEGHSDGFVVKLGANGAHLWSTYLGGANDDEAWGVATDALGNVYAAGTTYSDGWVSGGWDDSLGGSRDGFVVKLDANGAHLWSSYLGGTNEDYALGVATDASGNVYAGGYTNSPDWVSGGWDESLGGGNVNGFVVALTPAGAHRWSTYLGGTNNDSVNAIATDDLGNVYAAGHTSSPDWVSDGWEIDHGGGLDGFIVSLTPGGAHRWSTYLGGTSTDYVWGVATDASGNVYAAGTTYSPDWVSGGWDNELGGERDGYVVSLTSSGDYRWSTYIGGEGLDNGYVVATDSVGNVYTVGETQSIGWVSGGWDTEHGGEYDGFVVSLTSAGEHQWSSYFGGENNDYARAVATDAWGSVCLAGYTESSDWLSGGWDELYGENTDGFVVRVRCQDFPGVTVQPLFWEATEGYPSEEDPPEEVPKARVRLDEIMQIPVTVFLRSDDETELQVPQSVVIPAGQQTAEFDVTIVDDTELDGTQTARIWANIAGEPEISSAPIDIHDDETANLYLDLPSTTAIEGDPPLIATVRLDGWITTDLEINLASSDETAATVPLTVTVPAGMLEYEFPIEIVDDGAIDGLQTTEISVTADGWEGDDAPLDVGDNETRVLDFAIDLEGSFVTEGDPAFTGTIEIDGTYHSDLDVMLTSSDTSEVTVPEKVTILQGQTSVDFEITIEDDDMADGTQNVELSAWAPGWTSPEPIPLSVRDNEVAIPGDLNGDGYVGSFDLDIVRLWWNQTVPPGSLIQGDPSGDGMVGSADLDIVRANWGAGTPAAAASGTKSTEKLTEIPIGGEIEGTFAGTGDMHVYQVQVGAGEHLTIQLDGHAYGSNEMFVRYGTVPSLDVYDYEGTGSGMDKQVDVPSTQAGTYYVLAHAATLDASRDYTMRADVTSTLDTIPVGGEVDGQFEGTSDVHVYQVHVGAGEHLTIQLDGHAYGSNEMFVRYGTVPSMDVYDYEGTGSGMDKQVDVPSTQAGTYYVLAHAATLDASRDYTMRADVTSTLDTIPVGGEVDGQFEGTSDVHVYQVHVGAGEHLTIQLDGHAYGSNTLFVRYGTVPSMDVYDYEGTGSGMDKQVDVPSTQAGTYYVLAHAATLDASRDYTMRADVTSTLDTIPVGGEVDGQFEGTSDVHVYQVHVGAGEHLTIQLDGHAYGSNEMFVRYGTVPSLDVYDHEGTGSDMDKFVDVPSTQAGMYYVLVHASTLDASRDYTMRADVLATRLPGDLNVDGTVGSADLDIVRGNWGTTVSPGVLLRGDPSGDGTVGSADLDIIRAHWGAATTAAGVRTDSDTSTRATPLHDRLLAAFDAALENWDAARETRDAARETWAEALNALHVRESRKDKTTSRHAAADAAVLAWME